MLGSLIGAGSFSSTGSTTVLPLMSTAHHASRAHTTKKKVLTLMVERKLDRQSKTNWDQKESSMNGDSECSLWERTTGTIRDRLGKAFTATLKVDQSLP